MLQSLPFRIATASALILNLATGPAMLSAQSPTDVPTYTVRANTRLVVVDVVVTDKKGQPVTGLKVENFVVDENGKKQKLSIFVPPGVENGPQPTPAPEGILSNHPEHVRTTGIATVFAARCG